MLAPISHARPALAENRAGQPDRPISHGRVSGRTAIVEPDQRIAHVKRHKNREVSDRKFNHWRAVPRRERRGGILWGPQGVRRFKGVLHRWERTTERLSPSGDAEIDDLNRLHPRERAALPRQ